MQVNKSGYYFLDTLYNVLKRETISKASHSFYLQAKLYLFLPRKHSPDGATTCS